MLAARRSFGSLRNAARIQAAAPPVPAVLAPAASRGLMSAVLLSSDRKVLQAKTVKQLQQELGERGLSTKGKKDVLVDRLLTSRRPTTAATTSAIAEASFSTSSIISAPAPSAKTAAKSKPSTAPIAEVDTSIPQSVVSTESVPVHAPSPVLPGSAPPTAGEADAVTAAPGMVVDKQAAETVAQEAESVPGGGIDMPSAAQMSDVQMLLPSLESQIEESELMIPSMPDNFKNPPEHDPFMEPFVMHPSWLKPQVHAVEPDTTLHHSGAAEVITDDPNTRTTEPQKEYSHLNDSTLVQELLSSVGVRLASNVQSAASNLSDAASERSQSILSALESDAGLKLPKLATMGQSSGSAKQEKFKFQDRPLDEEESRGVYLLGGILGLGYLLGVFGSRKADQKQAKPEQH